MATMPFGSEGGIALQSGMTGSNIVVTEWNSTLEHEVFDSTAFANGEATITVNFKEKSYGMYHMTGSCSGWGLDSAVPAIGTAGTINASPTAAFILYTRSHTTQATRKGYQFDAVVSNMRMSVQQSGQFTVTLDFESSGPVTLTSLGA